ncbi:hypothetical protein VOI32_36405 [Paraburkholderia caribensis]|uniref:Apea-like HEPN domain-containing protein n=1 Tax=Paraburkholderia caribensis TaxID=75105 RepID=A0A9Q6S1P9_9BURK|nr:hypothetical protein [Paraburkholderia caribensis]MCO4881943.1 hypothetical protein [Paraburkholderia caribensis]PTB25398.1 hypothetical protein C9I56_28570 [Paraburkholderia caribensis]QLB62885.1 hypothetical protein A9O66_11115 [Paraburkholderia caribensis]
MVRTITSLLRLCCNPTIRFLTHSSHSFTEIHPPGEERLALQREIFELYDKRSAAAHGKPKHNDTHLVQTFNILQRVLVRMIEDNEVPSKAALNNMLLGAS